MVTIPQCAEGVETRGYEGTGLEGHWRDLEGTKKERGDNCALPLPLRVPLECSCLLIIPGDCSFHCVPLKRLWEGQEG